MPIKRVSLIYFLNQFTILSQLRRLYAPLPSDDVGNNWSYISTPPYVFMV